MAHGNIHWSELATSDVEGAKSYYSTTAGWAINGVEMSEGTYWLCNVDDVPVAGMIDITQLGDPNIPPHWMTYIAVDDVDLATQQTKDGGGVVVREPFDVPGVGRIAIFRDPAGATIGMMTPADNG